MEDLIAGWHFKGVTGCTVFSLSPFKQEHLLKTLIMNIELQTYYRYNILKYPIPLYI